MRKLGTNKKLKFGILLLESGICKGRIRNPATEIRNPRRGIQNEILSWITLHRAIFRLHRRLRGDYEIEYARGHSGCRHELK